MLTVVVGLAGEVHLLVVVLDVLTEGLIVILTPADEAVGVTTSGGLLTGTTAPPPERIKRILPSVRTT